MCAETKDPRSYIQRTYRDVVDSTALISSFVKVKDTDLHILADRDVTVDGKNLVLQYRLQIENYIAAHPEFSLALMPLARDPLAPKIVRDMLGAAQLAEVGPMASVAGAIAEYVGRALLADGCEEVIVENGGDLFINRAVGSKIAIFAGDSPLSLKLGLALKKEMMPIAVCTSSGSVGHSLSFGSADSVTVVASSASLADAAATRLGNEVGDCNGAAGFKKALGVSRKIEGILGVVVIRGDKIGAVGDVELVKLS